MKANKRQTNTSRKASKNAQNAELDAGPADSQAEQEKAAGKKQNTRRRQGEWARANAEVEDRRSRQPATSA